MSGTFPNHSDDDQAMEVDHIPHFQLCKDAYEATCKRRLDLEYDRPDCKMKVEIIERKTRYNLQTQTYDNIVSIGEIYIERYHAGTVQSTYTEDDGTVWIMEIHSIIVKGANFPTEFPLTTSLTFLPSQFTDIPVIIPQLNSLAINGVHQIDRCSVEIDISESGYLDMHQILQIIVYFEDYLDDRLNWDHRVIKSIRLTLNSHARKLKDTIYGLTQLRDVVKNLLLINVKNQKILQKIRGRGDLTKPPAKQSVYEIKDIPDTSFPSALASTVVSHPDTSFPPAVAMRILF